MSIEAIAAMTAQVSAMAPAVAAPMPVIPPDIATATNDGMFDRLVSSLQEIDAGFAQNTQAATELALGQSDNLHQVIIGAERTRLQFELAMSMRNRVLEAYQEIMRMQV